MYIKKKCRTRTKGTYIYIYAVFKEKDDLKKIELIRVLPSKTRITQFDMMDMAWMIQRF